MLLVGLGANNEAVTKPESPEHFTSYTKAYHAAQETKLPMLVVLNPGKDVEDSVEFESISKTKKRRELLKNYVVCVLDTETAHGKKCKELFKAEQLPKVVVIDKNQKSQVFRSSEEMYGQLWTDLLTQFKDGATAAQTQKVVRSTQALPIRSNCPTCPNSRGYSQYSGQVVSGQSQQYTSGSVSAQSGVITGTQYLPIRQNCPSCRRYR